MVTIITEPYYVKEICKPANWHVLIDVLDWYEWHVAIVDKDGKVEATIDKFQSEGVETSGYFEYIIKCGDSPEDYDNCDGLLVFPPDNRTYEEYSYDYVSPPLPYVPDENLTEFNERQKLYRNRALALIVEWSEGDIENVYLSPATFDFLQRLD